MKKKNRFFILILLNLNLIYLSRITHGFETTDDKIICPNKDHIVDIDVKTQQNLLLKAGYECIEKSTKINNDSNSCQTTWDSVICWPETKINETLYLPCPNYVNKFNMLNMAHKSCQMNATTLLPVWSKTNFSFCMTYDESDLCRNDTCNIESHMKYIIIIRICGYVISMLSLSLSIIILLRPKLRCARNYVHINLFLAFVLRTILVMLTDSILHSKSISFFQIESNLNDTEIKNYNVDKNYIACKIIMVMFRYSGSVYHVAIFAEAIYLVLLLKFPYYNELKGCKFCIFISWTLPLLWITPWTVVKAVVDNIWCWHTESNFNLITKIPHSLLLISNICCAIFIIRILYSKMRIRNLSREKLIKYRRLAKSILILIPIFGLHFIFFSWLPYASLMKLNISDCFEIVVTYIETSFNAFQGLVVSFTCCFIHREVRIEFILYGCQLLKKIKCLQSFRCMQCLDSDYIRQLRYIYHERRGPSVAMQINNLNNNDTTGANSAKRFSKVTIGNQSSNLNFEEENPMLPNSNSSNKFRHTNGIRKNDSIDLKKLNPSQSVVTFSSVSAAKSKCCGCLFSNSKNDFFTESRSNSKVFKKRNDFFIKIKNKNLRLSSINDTSSNKLDVSINDDRNSILKTPSDLNVKNVFDTPNANSRSNSNAKLKSSSYSKNESFNSESTTSELSVINEQSEMSKNKNLNDQSANAQLEQDRDLNNYESDNEYIYSYTENKLINLNSTSNKTNSIKKSISKDTMSSTNKSNNNDCRNLVKLSIKENATT